MLAKFIIVTLSLCGGGAMHANTTTANNHLALTPPRGFSTWNAFPVHSIDEGTARRYLAGLVDAGLPALGYKYFIVDEPCFTGRDAATGELLENRTTWPGGLKAFGAELRAAGMELGVSQPPSCCTRTPRPTPRLNPLAPASPPPLPSPRSTSDLHVRRAEDVRRLRRERGARGAGRGDIRLVGRQVPQGGQLLAQLHGSGRRAERHGVRPDAVDALRHGDREAASAHGVQHRVQL